MEKKENYSFPSEAELKEIRGKTSNPNYPYKNKILPSNASGEEKFKYQICQAILVYQQENDLPVEEVANQLNLDEDTVSKILRGYIENFSLDNLIAYTKKLNGHLEVKIDGKLKPTEQIQNHPH